MPKAMRPNIVTTYQVGDAPLSATSGHGRFLWRGRSLVGLLAAFRDWHDRKRSDLEGGSQRERGVVVWARRYAACSWTMR